MSGVVRFTNKTFAALLIAISALRAPSNRLEDTQPRVPHVLASLSQIERGAVTFIPPQSI